MNKFKYVLEKELFRLYFSSIINIDRNIENLCIYSPCGIKGITSVINIIQFISNGKVVQEITVCFRFISNKLIINLEKHILNKNDDQKILLHFPKDEIIFDIGDTIPVEFTRFENRFFVIKINDCVEGFLVTNCKKNNRVDIESVIKCFVNIGYKYKIDNSIHFILKKPILNKGKIELELNKQHRISMSRYKKKNIDTYFNIGITNITFINSIAKIYSIGYPQKIIMDVINKNDNYIFHNPYFVY